MKYVILSNNDGNVVVNLEEVVYCAVDSRNGTFIRFSTGDIVCVDQKPREIYEALKDYEETL